MKTIIFDFDGTIADSLEVTIGIYRDLTNDRRVLTADEVEELRKLPLLKVASAIGVPLWKVPFLVRKGRKIMHSRLGDIKVFDDLPHVFEKLKADGYDLRIVSSNSIENVQTFLKKHDLDAYFTDIHGSVGLFSKARVLRKIIKKDKLQCNMTYYIGDEARDIIASRKAGIRIISVAWGYNHESLLRDLQPYAIARTPHELYDILSVD